MDRVERLEHDLTAQLVATGLAFVGFGLTYAVLTVGSGGGISGRYAGTSEFTLWLFLSAAQTSFWCLVAWPLWQWCRSLLTAIPAGRALLLAGLSAAAWIVLIAVPIIAFDQREGIRSPLDAFALRGALLSALGLRVAVPAVLGFMALRVTAQDDSWPDLRPARRGRPLPPRDGPAPGLPRRPGWDGDAGRRGLGSPLPGREHVQRAVPAGRRHHTHPGAAGPGGVAGGRPDPRLPPRAGALDALGHDLLDRFCPVPALADDDFLPGLERRREFAELLGLGSSARADLESAIVILSPLLGSLLATFLDTST